MNERSGADQPTASASATTVAMTMTMTMTAIVQDAYGTEPEDVLRRATVTRPSVRDGEVRVRVHAASVDRGTWHVMAGLPYPVRAAGFGLRRPVSALTALQAVRDHARVQADEKVLIVGASGGVGSFAVQIAKAFGAEVTGVCSTAGAEAVRGAGADHVIDHTRADPIDGRHRYDVILDIAGNRRLSRLRGALTPTGRLLIVGGETDGRWFGGTGRQLRALLLSPFVRQTLGTFVASENSDDLVVLRGLIESGQVRPVIDSTYPLGEVSAALLHLVEGHPRGKIVIAVRVPGRG